MHPSTALLPTVFMLPGRRRCCQLAAAAIKSSDASSAATAIPPAKAIALLQRCSQVGSKVPSAHAETILGHALQHAVMLSSRDWLVLCSLLRGLNPQGAARLSITQAVVDALAAAVAPLLASDAGATAFTQSDLASLAHLLTRSDARALQLPSSFTDSFAAVAVPHLAALSPEELLLVLELLDARCYSPSRSFCSTAAVAAASLLERTAPAPPVGLDAAAGEDILAAAAQAPLTIAEAAHAITALSAVIKLVLGLRVPPTASLAQALARHQLPALPRYARNLKGPQLSSLLRLLAVARCRPAAEVLVVLMAVLGMKLDAVPVGQLASVMWAVAELQIVPSQDIVGK